LIKIFVLVIFALLTHFTLIKFFHRFKAYQPIYNLSPSAHQKKSKTPTLGGITMLLSVWLGWAFFFTMSLKVTWLVALYSVFALIGFFDDLLALALKKNKGLSAKQKFILQCFVSLVFIYLYSIYFSGLDWWHYPFYTFVIVGTSNATNLTDGLDGLLAGCSLITLFGFYYIMVESFQIDVSRFIVILIIIVTSFLLYNWNPAKLFMGDTGSLALGAVFAGLALLYADVWILLSLGAVYILETLSVIIQVIYFKRTKKRIFLMSPLHHHFELLGFKELHIVLIFYVIAFLFMLPVYF
tara:strand:- start:3015 stop:3905 length:891 start_codon:yes stop_codon:yes gene_type:complete